MHAGIYVRAAMFTRTAVQYHRTASIVIPARKAVDQRAVSTCKNCNLTRRRARENDE
jgi:hypothetical protein